MQVPGITVKMSLVSTRNVTGTYGLGYGLHAICAMQITDTGNDHATQPKLHSTTREEVELAVQWKKEICHRGRREIKLHHLHCYPELLLQQPVLLTNFTPCEVLHI